MQHAGGAHARNAGEVLRALGSSTHGLAVEEAAAHLSRHGPNALPHAPPPSAQVVFLRQFRSPRKRVAPR